MILPLLLRVAWPIIIVGVVGCALAIAVTCIFTLDGHPWIRRTLWIAPFAYPLLCWALFSGAARYDARTAERLRESGAVASATVVAVRDLGIDVNVNPLLELQLQVTPPDAEPFTTRAYVNPSRLRMHQVQPGTSLRVRYDPVARSRLVVEE